MRTVFLVRHAETAWNKELRFQGQIDVPLSDEGRAQAHSLRARLEKRPVLWDSASTAVVSSDLQRAHETAQLAIPGREIHLEPDLREMRYGIFEGLSRHEIQERYPEEYRQWVAAQDYVVAGSEKRGDARERARQAIERWLLRLSQPNVVVMTHGGIMRQLLNLSVEGSGVGGNGPPTQLSFGNVAVHLISIEQTRWVYSGSL